MRIIAIIFFNHRYQETLPKVIHSRKEAHVTHEELVQITKWKLYRGKNRSRILDLVRINTELAVATTTKKAFKKASKDICAAINALTNLKGIGPATASGTSLFHTFDTYFDTQLFHTFDTYFDTYLPRAMVVKWPVCFTLCIK